jgi:hypothetical protein
MDPATNKLGITRMLRYKQVDESHKGLHIVSNSSNRIHMSCEL